jgi:acyl dehydratase
MPGTDLNTGIASTPPDWFEDYTLGQTFESPVRVVTDDDVRAYVRFSNDVRPILGASSAHGLVVPQMYLFSLGVGLLLHGGGGYIPSRFVAFFGFDSVTFHRRVHGGDTIISRATVDDLTPRTRNGLVKYRHETLLTSGEVIVSSVQRILVERRSTGD